MTVGNMGPDEVETASRDDTIDTVVETFEEEDVGAVIVEENSEPVGVVTDRDVALSVTETDDVASLPTDEVMTENPVTLHEDEGAMEISRTIEEHNVRRIPIVDENGEITGIVTLDDLVATIGEQLENVSDTIEAQSPEYRP